LILIKKSAIIKIIDDSLEDNKNQIFIESGLRRYIASAQLI